MGFCIGSLFDTRSRTIVVAASNSIDPTLAPAAYRCDGTADQVEINAAITALGATGGTVILLEGTYEITASINLATLTALVGQGAGTVLRVPNGHDATLYVILGNGVNRVLVADLRIDGNRANQSAGTMYGVRFDTVTYSKVVNCWIEEMYDSGIALVDSSNYNLIVGNTCKGEEYQGIYLFSSDYNKIMGNFCSGDSGSYNGIYLEESSDNTVVSNVCTENGDYGIYVYNLSNNNTVTGNTCFGNYSHGIYLDLSINNTVTGNTSRGNAGVGIFVDDTSNNNTIVGNTVAGNDYEGIYIYNGSDYNTIVGNTVIGNSQDTDNNFDGIIIDTGSDYNNVQGNTVRHGGGAKQHLYGIDVQHATCTGNLVIDNDIYLSGKTANFRDLGTGTVVINNRGWVTENNVLSPAFAIDAIAVVTVTIPHGLNVTPSVEDCQLTVVEDTDVDDWAEGYVKVESVGAVNVVAKVNVTTASGTGSATAKLALHVDLAGA